MLRLMTKSHKNGSGEQVYFSEIDDENKPAEDYFFMAEGETVDIDILIDCPELENCCFPFNRALKAV